MRCITKLIHAQNGYALLAVMVFTIVVVVAGLAFFTLSSYETRGAIYRQASTEAFYLADGAVERSRARFIEDRTWRDGWVNVTEGHGEYNLTITDTTFAGHTEVVQLLAEGRVGQATRRIEVMAEVPPTAWGLGILILGNADVGGNICVDGNIHIVGDADFGPHDVHLVCGSYTSDFRIMPPPVYTDPDHFPDATYYYVRGQEIGGVYHGRIFNHLGVDITTALGDSLTAVTTYDGGTNTFVFDFDSEAEFEFYFNDSTGIFRRNPGDLAAVVNFGEPPLMDPPGIIGKSEVVFDAGPTSLMHTTVINSRFVGVTEDQRIDPDFWLGGMTYVKQIIMEPYYGIALIPYDFEYNGGALVQIGTEAWPALVYVTQDVVDMNSNFSLVGAITVLGDWSSAGGPDLTFDGGFIANLPGYLIEEWPDGVSGTLRILKWRELPG